jgi:hypothetical protein
VAVIQWHQSMKETREVAHQLQKPILIDIFDPG